MLYTDLPGRLPTFATCYGVALVNWRGADFVNHCDVSVASNRRCLGGTLDETGMVGLSCLFIELGIAALVTL